MAFNDFGSAAPVASGDGFKFNFGGDDEAEPTAADMLPFNFDDYRTTPKDMVPAREMPADYDREEEMDEMAIEALFEDIAFEGRGSMKRATPPNVESMTGPLANIVRFFRVSIGCVSEHTCLRAHQSFSFVSFCPSQTTHFHPPPSCIYIYMYIYIYINAHINLCV